jgi:hypothetical protein
VKGYLYYSFSEKLFYLHFQIKLKLFRVVGNTKRKIIPLPIFNYCDVRRGMFGVLSTYKDFVENFYKFGNLTMLQCPLKKGYYYMKNILIDDSLLPSYIMRLGIGSYMIQSIILDESSRTKFWVSTTEFYVVLSVE